MKEIIYSLKQNFTNLFYKLKKDFPEVLRFMKTHVLESIAFIILAILAIFLIINLTGISKTVTVTVLSKYSKELVSADNSTSTYSYHIIVNKKTLFGNKETEYFVSDKNLYDYLTPEKSYKFKIINNSSIIKVTDLNNTK